jgi:hypothetical protein
LIISADVAETEVPDVLARMRWVVVASAVVAPLALAGCGSSSTPEVASAPPTGAVSQPAGQGRSTLQRVVLKQSDLPTGWAADASDPANDSNSPGSQRRFAHCAGMRNTDPDEVAAAHSPKFTSGQAQVTSWAGRYRRHSDIKSDTALFASPKAAGCFRHLFRAMIVKDLPAGAQVGRLHVRVRHRRRDDPHDVAGTVTVSIMVSAAGRHIGAYVTETAITARRIEADVTMTSIGRPIPAALRRRLAATVARRVAHL